MEQYSACEREMHDAYTEKVGNSCMVVVTSLLTSSSGETYSTTNLTQKATYEDK